MFGRQWSPEEDALILRWTAEGRTLAEIAAELDDGVSPNAVKQRRRRLDGRLPLEARAEPMYAAEQRTEEKLEVEAKGDTEVITAHSATIRDLDSLLAAAKVDLDVWEVEKWVANKWDQGSKAPGGRLNALELWQVKAWLRRRKTADLAEATRLLAKSLEKYSPRFPKFARTRKVTGAHLLQISMHDAHFGKLGWSQETGQNYDLKIAERLFHEVAMDLLGKARGFPLERVRLIAGNDHFHVDGHAMQTTNGTPQDADGRLPKIFKTGTHAYIRLIDALLPVAPIEIIWCPGNHDYHLSLWMVQVLAAHYRHCKGVTVDDSLRSRKAAVYGQTLICYTHGDEEKPDSLPLLLATEFRREWADTKYHEIHTGHLHVPSETYYRAADTKGGVVRRVLPSIAGADHYHFKKGFVGANRAAQALLYHREEGYVATFNSYVREV